MNDAQNHGKKKCDLPSELPQFEDHKFEIFRSRKQGPKRKGKHFPHHFHGNMPTILSVRVQKKILCERIPCWVGWWMLPAICGKSAPCYCQKVNYSSFDFCAVRFLNHANAMKWNESQIMYISYIARIGRVCSFLFRTWMISCSSLQ